MSLEDIVNVQISAVSAAPTRAGFGTPMIAACRVPWDAVSTDREREYSSPAGMVADGFTEADPAYRIAAVLFAQSPRVRKVKVGRRALAFTQVVDLTPAAPAVGTEYGLTLDDATVTHTSTTTNLATLCTALATAFNGVDGEDDDAITSGGSTAGTQTLTSFTGVIGGLLMARPRSLEFVFSSHADWDATTATVTGKDSGGHTISETFAIPNSGGSTVTGTKLFAQVTQVSIPAQSGTGGTFTLGIRRRFTADGSSGTKVVVTATDAGMVVPYAALTSTLSLKDATSNPGIATDLAAIDLADSDWYGLLLDSNSEAEVDAAAAWAEANNKLFGAQSADAGVLDSGTTTDVASDLKAAGYARTSGWFHPDLGTVTCWVAAGILGSRLPDDPGSDTWAYKTLRGVSAYVLTETQKSNVHAKRWNTYTEIAGIAVTEPGLVSDNEYADVIRFIDWLKSRTKERIFGLLTRVKKLPYTDAGVDLIKGEVLAQLRQGVAVGGLAADPAPAVSAPLVADVSADDRAARHLPGVEFSARLAGAIHTVDITGTVSV